LYKHRQDITIFPGFSLEGIPNRDSTAYISEYGLVDEVKTMFRGTLRYRGFAEKMEGIVEIGLLDETQYPFLAPDAAPITWVKISFLISTKVLIERSYEAVITYL
jgi:alpha-aminoadipic semialdehyde synthase